MIKNYLTIAFRNIKRNKIGSFINVFGLAIGISSCVLIFIFVRNEQGYDKWNPNAKRIYRVVSDLTLTGQTDHLALSSFQLGPTLKRDYPEVEHAIRMMPVYKQTIWQPGKVTQLENVYFTDSDCFVVFPFHFISGNPNTALNEPYTIVLTEESARTLFGTSENVLGRMLKFARASYKVTGVIRQPKNESHLNFSAFISISSLPRNYFQTLQYDWFRMSQATYVMFKTEDAGKKFDPKFTQFEEKHINPFLRENQLVGRLHFMLQPLPDIHLGKRGEHFEYAEVGNRSYIYIFSFVAIFILLIACINYMNLATARSTKRAKEVGIRKTAGANRSQLIWQFMSESVFVTLISVLLALCITEIMLPFFNQLTDKSLMISAFDPGLLLFILVVIVFVGFASGVYPAFYLSRFQPIEVLKSNNIPKSGSAQIRKLLVILQFCISITLITGTLVVYMQMQYVKNKDIGFSKDNVYVLRSPPADSSFNKKFEELKHEFLLNSNIVQVAGSDGIPGERGGAILQYVEYNGKKEERLLNMMPVDYNFLPLLNIPLAAGRNFSKDFASDDTAAFIVNETAVKQFGWKNPVGIKMLNALGYNGKIIGVAKDFNYASLHTSIEPLVMMLNNKVPAYVLLKVKPQNLASTISFIDTKWKMFSKKYPLESFFLDKNLDRQYRADEKMLTIFAYFSALTIIIACLGLLALTSFTTEQRTREIGIRKVMGASTYSIVGLLTKDFIKLVLIALIIAAPIAWFAMDKWLQTFAFRIQISAFFILEAGIMALFIAVCTIGYQAYRAANQNPAESIKYE